MVAPITQWGPQEEKQVWGWKDGEESEALKEAGFVRSLRCQIHGAGMEWGSGEAIS